MAAMTSRPWTAGSGDGTSPYTAAQWAAIWRQSYGSGVLRDVGGMFAVTSTAASSVTIASGAGYVDGIFAEDATPTTLAVSSVGATTGGRVVLRADWSLRQVRPQVLISTSGVTAAPAAASTSGTSFDISLATFTVTNTGVITLADTRTFAQFNTNHVRRAGDVVTGDFGSNWNIDPGQVPTLDATRNARIAYNRSGGAGEVDLIAAGGAETSTLRAYRRNGDGSLVQHFEVTPTALIGPIGTVPQLSHRRGGSSTDWNIGGTTAYAVTGAIREQAAVLNISIPIGQVSTLVTLTFPNAYTSPPLVLATAQDTTTSDTEPGPTASTGVVTATTAQIRVSRRNPANTTAINTLQVHVLVKGVA